MEKKKQNKEEKKENVSCTDEKCHVHGKLAVRGRSYKGTVISKHPKRIAIEFERTVYIPKYERYAHKKTKLHARLSDCMKDEVHVGDYVEIKECRPLSKIIHFVVIKKLHSGKQFLDAQKSKEQEKISDIKKIRSKEIGKQ